MRLVPPPNSRYQSGAVLIVSMIILVILTLLGVSAMNTTSMQERIAGNTQESVHAFMAAESGYRQALADTPAWDIGSLGYDPTSTYTAASTLTPLAGSADKAAYVPTFMGFSPPPPDSLYSATSFRAAHFNFRATGESASSISSIVNGGAYQIAPKPE